MIPAAFDYLRPESVDEAVSALGTLGEDAKLLAGGQSLLPLLRLRLSNPTALVDIGRIGELRGIREDGDWIVIGAATSHHEVLTSPLVRRHLPLLAEATGTVADPAVRHRGTFGGSLAHADPAGDLPAVALALDATLLVTGPAGSRELPVADFFVDYLQSALAPDELLTAVRLPKLGADWSCRYLKFHRVAQAWAVVGVAVAVRRANGAVAEARVGLANMGSRPVRAAATEAALAGAAADPAAVLAAAGHADDDTDPPSDLGGSVEYRRHLVRVLTARALTAALEG